MNILFTSAGRRVELLRAFRSALDATGGGRLIGADIDPLAPTFQVVDVGYMVPVVSDPGYTQAIARICELEDIDLVFPLIDPEIEVLAARRTDIEASGCRVVVVPHEAARITSDKLLTADFFKGLGVPTPDTRSAREALDANLDYPVFLKPRAGSAGAGAFKVTNRRELEFFCGYVDDPVVQECLEGPEITSDILCGLQGEVLGVVSRRRIEVRSGEVSKGVTIVDEEIIEHCCAIAVGLGAIGPITAQCMHRDGRICFTEVNCRFGGGVPLGIAAGVDAPLWMIQQASGVDPCVPALGDYHSGLYLTRFDDSFTLSEDDREQLSGRRIRP